MKTKSKSGKIIQYLIRLWLLLIAYPIAGQQQLTINGKINDGNSLPIIGATIAVKGTASGTISNEKGEFALKISQSLPVTLAVSFVGYKTQEYDVYEIEPLSITLEEDLNKINAVVVIGYGTKRREELTGSVTSIPISSIKQAAVSSFDNALQGKAAGVQITQTSGQPGSGVSIRIRGGNSITGGNEPLFIIDGFPVYNNNSDASAGVASSASVNPLSSLSPGDIESIDVLKDAASTSIYGARGTNGVVIITTKRGKSGEGNISYEGYYGIQKVGRTLPLLNAKQWTELKNEARVNSGKAPQFTQAQIDSLGEGTDWQAAAFGTAPIQNHQLTFTGGDDKTHYALSANYFNQKGILLNTGFERFSVRINVDRNLTSKLKIGANINGSNIKSKLMNGGAPSSSTGTLSGSIITSLLFMPPTVSVRDENGNYTFRSPYESAVANPIAALDQIINRSSTYRFIGNFFGEYTLANDLILKTTLGADVINNKQNKYLPSTIYEGFTTNGSATIGSRIGNTWLNENTLTYTKSIGSFHNLDVLAGFTQQGSHFENVTAGSQQFVSDELTYNKLESGSLTITPTSSSESGALLSYLGRISYSYNHKYYFTSSLRADGSSRLGKNNRWGYFPSASIAWQINKENFLKSLALLNNLKLRFSFGVTGNQEIGSYQSLSTLNTYTYILGNKVLTGFAPSRVSNPDLKWEKTYQYDGGFDIGILSSRVSFSIDAYYKKTKDLLLTVPVAYTSGYTTSLQNCGVVDNKGLEISLNTENLKNIVVWNSAIVFSTNKNKVVSLGGGITEFFPKVLEVEQPIIVRVGEPLGSFYGYKIDGIFKSTDDINNTPRIDQTGTKPGDQRYKNLNNDNVITQAGDRTILGNAQPKFLLGFTNNFSFKNLDLNILLQSSYGNKLYNKNKQELELTTGFQNSLITVLDRWSPSNENGTVPRANENVPVTPVSDRFIEDASYVRLKNITIGYNLPKSLLKKVKIKQARIYVSAQNLVTWTKYSGYDPEVSYFEQSSITQGVDYGVYPNSKTILSGISITF